MSKILDLYSDLHNNRKRFIDDIFVKDEYKDVLPKLTIFDIGAYEGEFAFYSLNLADKIYCFEPDPVPYKELKRRVKEYELKDKIKIYSIALSDDSGNKYFSATHDGGSRLVKEETSLIVPTKTLAQFMDENGINHIDILKIDIEDGETAVFNAPDFKNVADKIDLIVGEHLSHVHTLLESYGFKTRPSGHNMIYER